MHDSGTIPSKVCFLLCVICLCFVGYQKNFCLFGMGKSGGNRINKKFSVGSPGIFALDRFVIIIKNCRQ